MDLMYNNLRPYAKMLIGRSRAWGVLCMAEAVGDEVSVARMVGPSGDADDIARLIGRLETMGLAEREGADAVRLTERGWDTVAETRVTGAVPRVVQDDPNDWRHRAWTSMRIRGRFTVAEVEAACDGPSTDSVAAYIRELVRSGHLRRSGRDGRWAVYQLILDEGPAAPEREPRTQTREHDDERPWRRRAWSALWRLCRTGEGVRVAELAAAARVSAVSAGKLLAELHELGALTRSTSSRAYVYALTPQARERAEVALKRSDRRAGRSEWRRRAWSALLDAGRTTARETAEAGPCALGSARGWLAALADGGYLERLPSAPPSPAVYVVPPDAPVEMPTVTISRPSRASSDRPEVAVSDG